MNAEPETGTEVQAVGLGPQKLEGEGNETGEGEKPTHTAVSELKTAVGNWGSVLLGLLRRTRQNSELLQNFPRWRTGNVRTFICRSPSPIG